MLVSTWLVKEGNAEYMKIPRILLLTRWAPDGRYSGAELTRKAVACLPPDCLKWAYISGQKDKDKQTNTKCFQPQVLHWRLVSSVPGYVFQYYWDAKRIAAEIYEWSRAFDPQVIWLASDMEAIPVALHLKRLTSAFLHFTVYDAFEHCKAYTKMPSLFYPIYMKQVQNVVGLSNSMDAVSEELLRQVIGRYSTQNLKCKMVFPPSISLKNIMGPPPGISLRVARERNIGFCGSSRVSDRQWRDFLGMLSELDYEFKLHVFGSQEYLNDVEMPTNVEYVFHGYAQEENVIRFFHNSNIHLLYLGVWKDEEHSLFARTSLSSKLTTYAASGVPVVADVPEDSVAWRLLEKYDAGVLCGNDRNAAIAGMNEILGDESVWEKKAQGCSELCREHFDLEKNVQKFRELLSYAEEPE